MVTVTCDMCGEKLNAVNNLVNVEFTYDGLIALGRGSFHNTEKQLCITCATRLLNWVENQLEKGDEGQ